MVATCIEGYAQAEGKTKPNWVPTGEMQVPTYFDTPDIYRVLTDVLERCSISADLKNKYVDALVEHSFQRLDSNDDVVPGDSDQLYSALRTIMDKRKSEIPEFDLKNYVRYITNCAARMAKDN